MEEPQKLVLDTSALMQNTDGLENNIDKYQYIIPSTVADELDNLKESDSHNRSFKARRGLRFIEKYESDIKFVISDICSDSFPASWDFEMNDNRIINVAQNINSSISTFDRGMKIKAQVLGIEVIQFDDKEEEDYKGYKEIVLDLTQVEDAEKLAKFYSMPENNCINMHENEYLIIRDLNKPIRNEEAEIVNHEVIDTLKFFRGKFIQLYKSGLKSHAFGNLKGKDAEQDCAIDSFMSNQITMVKGKAGTGKSLLSLGYAMKMIESNKYDKLIIFCNTVASKDSAKLGFYPGTKLEKLLDSSVGGMLASKFGDRFQVESLIKQDKLELIPFSDLRGWDGTGTNSVIVFSEAQNLTKSLMKLGIERIGEDCCAIIDGDIDTQIDMHCFEGNNNGMRRASEVFRGRECYGEVTLRNVYRSEVAKIASEM